MSSGNQDANLCVVPSRLKQRDILSDIKEHPYGEDAQGIERIFAWSNIRNQERSAWQRIEVEAQRS